MSRIEEIKTRAWALNEVAGGEAILNCKELAQDFEFLLAKLKLAEEALEAIADGRKIAAHKITSNQWVSSDELYARIDLARHALAELRKA